MVLTGDTSCGIMVMDYFPKHTFKKWYKREHLCLCDFGLINSYIAWNKSCEQMVVRGIKMGDPLKKCQFRSILAEYLMNFTAVADTDNTTCLHSAMPSIHEKINQGHFPTTNIDTTSSVRSAILLRLSCDV